MVLTVNTVLQNMKHELGGGDLSIELDKFRILNEAGEHLYSMHPWKWATGRSALLDLRGSVSGTAGDWTVATLTLTDTGSFSTYTLVAGDEIEILSGTGVTTGVYTVVTNPTDNTLTLDSAIAAGDLSATDIEWQIFPGTISLPTDLREIISIQSASTSNIIWVSLTSADKIAQFRGANALTQSPALFYAAVVYQGSPPVPILEIWPSSGSNNTGALRIFYRSRWTNLYSDTAAVEVPEFMESLYVWLARAYAAGYERNDVASIHQRVAEIMASPLFDSAKRSDGQVQPFTGRPRYGGATMWRQRTSGFSDIVNRIGGPT
jgi:hypothetical protein